jgi:uncharacterized membrane protein HdeD (DUF308 family)
VGAYAFAEGVVALVAAFRIRDSGHPLWPFVVVGLLGIAAGIATLLWPGITALTLLMLIAAWAIVMGVFQIFAAVRLRKAIEGEWLLALSGLLSIAFGALVVVNPGAGALAVVWIIAACAIAFGALLIALGFRVRSLRSHRRRGAAAGRRQCRRGSTGAAGGAGERRQPGTVLANACVRSLGAAGTQMRLTPCLTAFRIGLVLGRGVRSARRGSTGRAAPRARRDRRGGDGRPAAPGRRRGGGRSRARAARRGWGFADLSRARPSIPRTTFRVASV